MAGKDSYIAALERKLAELSGIEVDQIRKNQVSSLMGKGVVYGFICHTL